MKILYGIQGTGNGHISRARMMAHCFAATGVEVDYLFSGRAKKDFFAMEVFGDYQLRKGLSFNVSEGQVNYLKTARDNKLLRFCYDVLRLDVSTYDVIISDFEPVSAWAGKLKNKPVLGIGHQYAFGDKTPMAGDNIFTRNIMHYFAPADFPVGLHWAAYNDYTLPPIINTDLCREASNGKVVVYLPFENQQRVTRLLNQFPHTQFIQYSPHVIEGEDYNVSLKKTSYEGFQYDLSRAAAVICNAGFELVSECLYLGLPILVKPVNGQMEQASNARALQSLGYADVMDVVSFTAIATWLKAIKREGALKPLPIPNVAKALVGWVVQGSWHDKQRLVQQLWQPLQQAQRQTPRYSFSQPLHNY
ncbi:MJ1255/VC2487 family glycosyltransferase [Dasania marina]|uniref:MJ1255/VC2487 family glycosyltransferase n=1 Tax=Dasania marina TaxID=471499 RepID=UPI0004B057C3|nr:MJ1255/VC2487 family glycosyltransferase [Dasania marina]